MSSLFTNLCPQQLLYVGLNVWATSETTLQGLACPKKPFELGGKNACTQAGATTAFTLLPLQCDLSLPTYLYTVHCFNASLSIHSSQHVGASASSRGAICFTQWSTETNYTADPLITGFTSFLLATKAADAVKQGIPGVHCVAPNAC
eukprot:scaffold76171_cov20-Tisochrysis_lutea.AAC.1